MENFEIKCYTDLEEIVSWFWRGSDLLLFWIRIETFWNVIFSGKMKNQIFKQGY